MDYKKVQSEIISEIYKCETKKLRPPYFDEMPGTEYVGVITDIAFAYIFSKNRFLLDKSRLKNTTELSKLYGHEMHAQDLVWHGVTRTKKIINTRTVIELFTKKGDIIPLDEKFVRKFGKPSDLLFRSEGTGNVVFTYDMESTELVGMIMPRIEEGDKNA